MSQRRRPILVVPSVVLAMAVLVGLPAGAHACELLDQLLVGCAPPPPPTDQPPPSLPSLEDLPGVITLPTASPAPSPAPAPPRPPSTTPVLVPEAARHLLDLANAERAAVGAQPLAARADVTEIAAGHSLAMAKRGAVWHNAAFVTDLVGDLLGATWVRGENVAWSNDVDHAHRLLIDSPAHRRNMLDPRYAVAGFAVARSGDGNYWVTQNFLESISSPVPPSPPPPTASQDAAPPSPTPDPAREVATAPGSPVAPSTSGASSPDRPPRSSEELDPSPVPVPDRFDGAVLVAGQRRPPMDGVPPGMGALAAILVGVVAVAHGLWWWTGRPEPCVGAGDGERRPELPTVRHRPPSLSTGGRR